MLINKHDRFNEWRIAVINNLSKIIKNIPNNIDIELTKLYNNCYHPYTAAIILVLKSDDYKKGNIISSFVIPYDTKVIIYMVN